MSASVAHAWLAFALGHASGTADRLGFEDLSKWLFFLARPPRESDRLTPRDGEWIALALELHAQRYVEAGRAHVTAEEISEMSAKLEAAIEQARVLASSEGGG